MTDSRPHAITAYAAAADARRAIDPVCGMTVDPHATPHRAEHQGRPYYFCSAGCRGKFAADPHRYLGGAPERQEVVPEGTIYTCPMHPEVRQVGPGACPICGMALEPELATAEAGPNPELADMSRRFWIGACADDPDRRARHGGAPRRRPRFRAACDRQLDPARARDPGGAVGAGGRSSCAAGSRSPPAISTCSR